MKWKEASLFSLLIFCMLKKFLPVSCFLFKTWNKINFSSTPYSSLTISYSGWPFTPEIFYAVTVYIDATLPRLLSNASAASALTSFAASSSQHSPDVGATRYIIHATRAANSSHHTKQIAGCEHERTAINHTLTGPRDAWCKLSGMDGLGFFF